MGIIREEFVTPRAARSVENYEQAVAEAYPDVATRPLGDLVIWVRSSDSQQTSHGIYGFGVRRDPLFAATGSVSAPGGSSNSSYHAPEVEELREELATERQRREDLERSIAEPEAERTRREEEREAERARRE